MALACLLNCHKLPRRAAETVCSLGARAGVTGRVTGHTQPLTVSVELLYAGLQLLGLQTLSFGQGEAFLTGVAVVVARTPTGATRPVTWLTVLAHLVHKETRPAVVNTLPVGYVEALLTPVALRLITVIAVFILAWFTLHGLVHIVGPLWARLVTVRPKLIVVVLTFDTHSGLLCISSVLVFTLLTAIVARKTSLTSGICNFTIRALQGHALSQSPESVSRPTAHTVESS